MARWHAHKTSAWVVGINYRLRLGISGQGFPLVQIARLKTVT